MGAPNPEPPKCDYSQYCSVVDCTKEGAAALCPDQCKVCGKIKVRTENWGYENSYAIGTCVSQQEYGFYDDYEEDCCLAPGTYSMDCIEVMLKSMESSIVMTLPVDIANPLRLLGNRLIPKNGINWVNLQEKLNDIQLSLLHI